MTTNHMAFNSAFLASNVFWENLTDEEKTFVEESMNVEVEQNIQIYEELEDESMKSMEADGVKFTEIKMDEELQKVKDEFIEKYADKDEKIKAFVEKAEEIDLING
jgi:TRAP-type transport system periplasmic protein